MYAELTKMTSHVAGISATKIDSADADRPRLRIVEAHQKLEDCRLARTGWTYERDLFAGAHIQRETIECGHVATRRVVKRDGVEIDGARVGGNGHRIRGRANRRFDCEQFEQPLGRAGSTLQIADDLTDRPHGTGDEHRVEHEGR